MISRKVLTLPNLPKEFAMLPNERFALACRAYYEEQGLVVDKTNGQFAHCPQPKRYGDTGYYLLWEHHQHQGLLQSKDIGECCFFLGGARKWLLECDPFPDNYFELWDIYEQYSGENGRKIMGKLHKEKDENGKSLKGLEASKRLHMEKDEKGKSLRALELNRKIHEKKNEDGKSLRGLEIARRNNSQIWESTIDGFKSNLGNVVKHNKENGWDPGARVRLA